MARASNRRNIRRKTTQKQQGKRRLAILFLNKDPAPPLVPEQVAKAA